MRSNQLHINLTKFEAKDGRRCEVFDEPRYVHCYSDSHNLFQAIEQGFAAVIMRCFGLDASPDPKGCRCDIACSDDEDERKRRFARVEFDRASQRGRQGAACCHVSADLQRFPRAVPEGYPKDEQAIYVAAEADDVFTAIAAARWALYEEVTKHECVNVKTKVRTNIDSERPPLRGALEIMRDRKAMLRDMKVPRPEPRKGDL